MASRGRVSKLKCVILNRASDECPRRVFRSGIDPGGQYLLRSSLRGCGDRSNLRMS